MIVPAPWEFCTQRDLPPASPRTFHDLFWDVVHTYAGHSCESLRLLREGGVALNRSLLAGSASLYDVVRPVLPPALLGARAIPPIVPMEELPAVECCEDSAAVMEVRARCFRYGESVARLVALTRDFSAKWGRLGDSERRQLKMALMNEKASRFQEEDLYACFTNLNFSGRGLRQLTSDVARFTNLTTLVLSNNPGLTSISCLPPACQVLVACGCCVREMCASNSLIFLGLAYNMMEQLDFLRGLPELRVLDLTRNAVFSMEAAIEALQGHPRLEEVTFIGCPIALLDNYSEHLALKCPRLLRLDRTPVDRLAIGKLEALEMNPLVLLRVKLCRLEGLCALMHVPVARDETLSSQRERKGSKGKKKAKSVVLGPAYEWTTKISLHGSWGGRGAHEGVVVMSCENICIWPDGSGAAQQQPTKKRSQMALLPIENACVLDHVVTAHVQPVATLSESLARPFLLEVTVHDEVSFPSGNSVKLTCSVGLLSADASSLVLNTTPSPRCITVQEPFVVSAVALEEKRVHVREIRESAAAALEDWKMHTQSMGVTSGTSALVGCISPKRSRSLAPTAFGSTSDQFWAETKRRETEMEELNLLASIEERRVEELRQLELSATLEFSLGSAPKVEEDLLKAGRSKGSRRRQGDKSKR